MAQDKYNMKISIWGTGNAGFRIAIALKGAGFEIPFVVNRSLQSAKQLSSILNKPEYNHFNLPDTHPSVNYDKMEGSDIIIVAISDDVLETVLPNLLNIQSVKSGYSTVCHISGATSVDVLNQFKSHGVFYPLMSFSKNKPVDMSIVPFLLESSDSAAFEKLSTLCKKLGSEYSVIDSSERLRMHVSAVFVSNFINYLASLSYDIATPHHVYLLPLAIETIRKAFLYGNPKMVQTGPAARGDLKTISKHFEILNDTKEHLAVYKLLSNFILEQNKQINNNG